MKVFTSIMSTRRRLLGAVLYKPVYRNSSKWVEPTGYLTGVSVYNSASKCKVPLILKNKNIVTWYMCGPTVYDSAHIGHASCYVKFDIIRRILTNVFDINVVLVMGITNIDDKIIKRAHLLKEDVQALSNRYENEFFKDMDNLHVFRPTITVRVTDIVPSIIEFVQSLLSKGMAYRTDDGSVYFDTTQHKQYGKLYPITYEDIVSIKKSTNDFALWKAAKLNEPSWNSPWGLGRPGWHIECSTIASNIFGSTVDLHSGGIDLLFPHHENEEAQSCAFHNVQQWVNYWLHTGHLRLKGEEKMSKSLKNTINISEFLTLHTADHFRMYCLLSNYRSDVEYTNKMLDYAKAIYGKIESFLNTCDSYVRGIVRDCDIHEVELLEKLACTKESFLYSLADDFDTAKAFGILLDFISEVNAMLHTPSKQQPSNRCPGAIAAVSSFIYQVTGKLGLEFSKKDTIVHYDKDTDKIIDLVVNFRSGVRELTLKNLKSREVLNNEKNLQLLKACDELRNNLRVVGIEIEDHELKSSWNIKRSS